MEEGRPVAAVRTSKLLLVFHKPPFPITTGGFTQIFNSGTGNEFWKNWQLDLSTPQDIKFLIIKFWTRRVADEDVETYR